MPINTGVPTEIAFDVFDQLRGLGVVEAAHHAHHGQLRLADGRTVTLHATADHQLVINNCFSHHSKNPLVTMQVSHQHSSRGNYPMSTRVVFYDARGKAGLFLAIGWLPGTVLVPHSVDVEIK